jgi:hypothetical protein
MHKIVAITLYSKQDKSRPVQDCYLCNLVIAEKISKMLHNVSVKLTVSKQITCCKFQLQSIFDNHYKNTVTFI